MTDTFISADRLLHGPAGQRLADAAVLVRDGRIVAVGRRAEIERHATADTRRYDFPGSTLLPGLINSHVHLAFDTSADPVGAFQRASPEQLLAGMAERADAAFRAGVTTVRDLGDDGTAFHLRDAIAAGERPGPRILAAGPPVTVRGGHCWFFGGDVDLSGDGDAQLREQVRRNIDAGADLIKVMASGGQLTPGGAAMYESQFTTGQLGVIVAEARRAGLRVAAHAHGADAISSAVEAGVHTVEHCGWMSGPGSYDRREQVASTMAAKGIYACAALSQNWLPLYQRLGDRGPAVFGRLAWMADLGVPFIAGTDAGLPGSVFDNYAGALGLYPWLGFRTEQAIEFATVNAAAALGLADTTGQLAPGLAADLLVVAGDPLTDLDALRDVRLVMTPHATHLPATGDTRT